MSRVDVECCDLKLCCEGDKLMCEVMLFRTSVSSIIDRVGKNVGFFEKTQVGCVFSGFFKKTLKKPSNGGFFRFFCVISSFFQFILVFSGFFMLYPYNVISKQENL